MLTTCPHSDGNSCEQYRLQDQRCQDCPLVDEDMRFQELVGRVFRGEPVVFTIVV